MFKVLSLTAAFLLVTGVAFAGIIDPCRSFANSSSGCIVICPGGDGDQLSAKGVTISITILDGASNPLEGIPATDFWLIDCDPALDMVLAGGSGSSDASAATDDNGQTTIEGDITAGGCADGLSVVVQGFIIEEGTPPNCTPVCLPILVRSPDRITPSFPPNERLLRVDLQDFSWFGLAYPPNPYDKCADFNCDAGINLQDFSIFGVHFNHRNYLW